MNGELVGFGCVGCGVSTSLTLKGLNQKEEQGQDMGISQPKERGHGDIPDKRERPEKVPGGPQMQGLQRCGQEKGIWARLEKRLCHSLA